ncbi:hypothetical protein [Roseibium salinum]|uniref:hypothetical protein n=1 Tax=Roseibium salinum TaxID=1604349 RepID=UPI003AAEBCFE
MLRTLGQTMGKMRRMSREFQSTFNDALREAEQAADIADMKKQVESVGNFNPLGDIKKSIEEDASKRADKPKTSKAEPAPNPNRRQTQQILRLQKNRPKRSLSRNRWLRPQLNQKRSR